jgi:hypothetical protein
MRDAQTSIAAAVRSARRTKRTIGRVAFSAAGFSAAYFLDPSHGAARRDQFMGYIRRSGRSLDEVVSQEATPIRQELRPVTLSATAESQ